MDSIQDLNTNSALTSRLYSKVTEIIDSKTGETQTIVSSFLQREKTKDDFIKLFVNNINFLTEDLSNSALRVVLIIIKNLNYQNVFKYDGDFVSYFANKNILSKSSVYRAIKELEEKRVIFKLTKEQQDEFDVIGSNSYIVNPQIIGKGSFKDLKKLRQTVVKTFDFDKLEMIQEVQVENEYEGLEEVINNPENYSIVAALQNKKAGLVENSIIVEEKEKPLELSPNSLKEPDLFSQQEPEEFSKEYPIFKLYGILNGVIDPNITAKDIKAQRLKEYE